MLQHLNRILNLAARYLTSRTAQLLHSKIALYSWQHEPSFWQVSQDLDSAAIVVAGVADGCLVKITVGLDECITQVTPLKSLTYFELEEADDGVAFEISVGDDTETVIDFEATAKHSKERLRDFSESLMQLVMRRHGRDWI